MNLSARVHLFNELIFEVLKVKVVLRYNSVTLKGDGMISVTMAWNCDGMMPKRFFSQMSQTSIPLLFYSISKNILSSTDNYAV